MTQFVQQKLDSYTKRVHVHELFSKYTAQARTEWEVYLFQSFPQCFRVYRNKAVNQTTECHEDDEGAGVLPG